RHGISGLLTSVASVIATATISPTLATHPILHEDRPLQRDPFPLDAAFWVAVAPSHTAHVPHF
ncbi:MAG TPA: hypothetical protein VMU55_03675, partial [Solirubrobacteraceae bacterium]|nr:hypothetical protein [Solirubrobacteraceae bacterium]